MNMEYDYGVNAEDLTDTTELLLDILTNRGLIAAQIDASEAGSTLLGYDALHVDKTHPTSSDIEYRIPPNNKATFHARFSKLGNSAISLDELLVEPGDDSKLSLKLKRREHSNRYLMTCKEYGGASYRTGDQTLALDCLTAMSGKREGAKLRDGAMEDFASYFAELSERNEESRSFSLVEDDNIYLVRLHGNISRGRKQLTDDRIEIAQLSRNSQTEPFTGIQLILSESSNINGNKTDSHFYLRKVSADTAEQAIEKVTRIEQIIDFEGESRDAISHMDKDHKAAIINTLHALEQSALN